MPYILLLILSVHSFLAGVALGTSDTSSTAVGIILAIVCHKGSAAMALGVTMLQNGVERRRYLGLMFAFSLVTPAGIGIGMGILTSLKNPQTIQAVSGIVGALSSGSFLYIASMSRQMSCLVSPP